MFGSNFFTNFGIPEFQGVDPQGGIFGPTAGQPLPGQDQGLSGQQPQSPQASIAPPPSAQALAPPAAGLPTAARSQPGIGSPSGLGGGVTGTGGPSPSASVSSEQALAPAAGIGSPFGRTQL